MTALAVLTLLLVAGFTARLTRLVIVDDVGLWFLRGPAYMWADRHEGGRRVPGWRTKLVSGLDCPFCVGFWLGAGVLASIAVVGGLDSHGTWAAVWRWVAGVFTLNYVVAHIGSRLDTEPDHSGEEPEPEQSEPEAAEL